MEEKDDETLKRLRKELGLLTKADEPSKKQKALDEYEVALKALMEAEKRVQEELAPLQQKHQQALGALQQVLASGDKA